MDLREIFLLRATYLQANYLTEGGLHMIRAVVVDVSKLHFLL